MAGVFMSDKLKKETKFLGKDSAWKTSIKDIEVKKQALNSKTENQMRKYDLI